MAHLLRSFELPVTVPGVVRAYFKEQAGQDQVLGRDKLECESFMHYQLRFVKDLVANAQGTGQRLALETASLNRRLRAEHFDDVVAILDRLLEHGLIAESELMRALQEAYEVREGLFSATSGHAAQGDFYHRQTARVRA
jgi:hypothetical protein